MKDLTEYLNTKNCLEELYDENYKKNLRRDLKRSKRSKKLHLLIPAISLVIYFGVTSLGSRGIDISHIFIACGMIGMQLPAIHNTKRNIEKFRKSADINLKELLRLLFVKEEDVNYECLQNSVITHKKENESVEYVDVATSKKILNHEIATEETMVYFKDIEDELKCLRELRQLVKFNGTKEEEHTLELLDQYELEEMGIPKKVKKKLMK